MEHNGHAWRKKHMIEQYLFVAHAQHNTTRTTNMDRRGRRAWEGSEQRACRWLDVIENEQDREDSAARALRVRARKAREGSEQCARRLEGNRERARERRQWHGARTRASKRLRM